LTKEEEEEEEEEEVVVVARAFPQRSGMLRGATN
jgi:hypothetical protein